MDAIQAKAVEFLKKYELYPGDISMGAICDAFMDEMRKGLASKKHESSLMMIPTWLRIDDHIPVNKPVIVIDAGGTNFRTALFHFDEEYNGVMEGFENHRMPGSSGEISKEEFFSTMCSYIEPLLDKSDVIGLCFSYPTEIQPNRDGRVLSMSKEIRVTGLIGEYINANLLERIQKARPGSKKTIIQLNDTVATLLGGKTVYPKRVFDSYLGFILGTGTNICYIEESKNIQKLRDDPLTEKAMAELGANMLVNIESGNFAKAPQSEFDRRLDQRTQFPGQYLFEKTISGGYQGALTLEILHQAAADGLFPEAAASALLAMETLATREIDDFLYYPYGDSALSARVRGSSEAAQTLYWLLDAVLEKAAMYVCASLTAVLKKAGKGKDPTAPVCITADGTTFYKSKLLRPKLERHVQEFMNAENGLYCEFVKAENGVLTGAAIAALQHS